MKTAQRADLSGPSKQDQTSHSRPAHLGALGAVKGGSTNASASAPAELGFWNNARCRMDRRSVRTSLTGKGHEVADLVKGVYDKHVRTVEQIGGIATDDFERMNNALLRLERFWTDQIRYKL